MKLDVLRMHKYSALIALTWCKHPVLEMPGFISESGIQFSHALRRFYRIHALCIYMIKSVVHEKHERHEKNGVRGNQEAVRM
jgi:hypothetical protein